MIIPTEDDYIHALLVAPGDTEKDYARREVIAKELAKERERVLAPFKKLFGCDPDTPCRTTWRATFAEHIECVEVPMENLRAAFAEAELAAS